MSGTVAEMESDLEVLFTPAEFSQLGGCDLSRTTCVVFDVLRATSSMVAALENGARRVRPVREIEEAVRWRNKHPEALLAGERQGRRILAAQSGGVDFDLGNSPREFSADHVRGREIIMTTTNGTRALNACAGAKRILAAAFLNLGAVTSSLRLEQPPRVLVVCAGTYEEAAYEDTLAAGALCDAVWEQFDSRIISDSAQIAREIWRTNKGDLESAMAHSRNAQRLRSIPELRDDVAFCLRRDVTRLVAELREGAVVRL